MGKNEFFLQQREMSEAPCSKRAKLAFAGSSKEMLIYKDGVKAALQNLGAKGKTNDAENTGPKKEAGTNGSGKNFFGRQVLITAGV